MGNSMSAVDQIPQRRIPHGTEVGRLFWCGYGCASHITTEKPDRPMLQLVGNNLHENHHGDRKYPEAPEPLVQMQRTGMWLTTC